MKTSVHPSSHSGEHEQPSGEPVVETATGPRWMPVRLTAQQTNILAFVYGFYLTNDQLPTAQSIADKFGFRSRNAAFEHLEALCRRGAIARNAVGKWKFTPEGRRFALGLGTA